jgi:hypothetical protein
MERLRQFHAAAKLIGLLALLMFIGALLMWLTGSILGVDTLGYIAQAARRARPLATLFWAGMIGFTALYWTNLIDWLIARKRVAAANRAALIETRWRITLMLLIADLVLIGNLPFAAFAN